MLYGEIVAICSQIHTKHINTLCGQNVEFCNVKLVARIVTTGLWKEFALSTGTKLLPGGYSPPRCTAHHNSGISCGRINSCAFFSPNNSVFPSQLPFCHCCVCMIVFLQCPHCCFSYAQPAPLLVRRILWNISRKLGFITNSTQLNRDSLWAGLPHHQLMWR